MLKKLLLSCLAIFGLTFFISSNSYADSLCSYQYDASNMPVIDQQLCTDHINDVRYAEVIYNYSVTGNTGGINAQFTVGYQNYFMRNWYGMDYYLVGITDSPYGFAVASFNATQAPADWAVNVNLYDTFPTSGIIPSGTLDIYSNGTYDVTNYASAVIDIPSELPPYSQIVVDSFWKYHVAIAGGLASIFAIFVVYRIIKSRLR